MQPVFAHSFHAGRTALLGAGFAVEAEAAPEWVHLLPAIAGPIHTQDGRGPYSVSDAEALIAASFAEAPELPIDENHATDLGAPQGAPAPARGWITAMEARADGIWGQVRWTKAGRELVADQAYRGISPVIAHSKTGVISRILRASLVNTPNLRGLAALHQEETVTFHARLAEALGLKPDADEDAILAAVSSKPDAPALQSALTGIAQALGLDGTATPEAVTAAAREAGRDVTATIPALQAQVTELSAQLQAITDCAVKTAAEAFVDGAIKEGRMGLNAANRDAFVTMHQENPARTEALIKGFAVAKPTHTAATPPEAASLHSAQDLVTRARALQAAEKAKGIDIDWADAVHRASETRA